MSMDRRRTTALVERIACVREAQAQQRLSDALARENQQRLLEEASAMRLRDTERGLMALLAGEELDLMRAVLYQDLASTQQMTLADDRAALAERVAARTGCVDELTRKAHYHEGAALRARDAARTRRLMEERKESIELIESWVLRGLRGGFHE